MDLYDIVIVGGGPSGLFGAYYAGLRGMRAKVVDALPVLGGQLAALYPEKYIYDMPGFPRVLARDLAAGLVEQAMQYGATVCLEEKALDLESDGEVVTLTTSRATHHARACLITAGVGAFNPRALNAPGVERFIDRGVAYHVRDRAAYAGKRVMIVGGGDSALDWALNLQEIAEHVTVVHRRDAFRAHEETVAASLDCPNIGFRLFHEVRAVHGEETVEAATVFHNKTDEEERIPCDAVLLFLGFHADLGPIKSWGLHIEKNSVVVNDRMETNIPRVYAAGDVTWHDGKLKLIATGTGEAAVAVNFAKAAIDPRAGAFPGHSSEINNPTRSISVAAAGRAA